MLRIRGLVRTSKQVRAALRAGIPTSEQTVFRRRLQGLLREVEGLCREHRMTPEELPAPSRNAYRFLRSVDLDALPRPPDDAPRQRVGGRLIALRNVMKAQDQLSTLLWQQMLSLLEDPDRRDGVRLSAREQVEQIEAICEAEGATPASLTRPSRRGYCWFRFISESDHLEAYLETLAGIAALAERWLEEQMATLEVHLLVMSPLWRRRTDRGHHVLKCNAALISAPQEIWRSLVRDALTGRSGSPDGLVARFAESEAFAEMLDELLLAGDAPMDAGRGVHHDLRASFRRVNADYFQGALERPRLRWSEHLTSRRFGHYQSGRDVVVISASLDDADIPSYVIDFVMYHELLHKQLGVQFVNGRRVAHSPAFRQAERRYTRYEEAEAFLRKLASLLT